MLGELIVEGSYTNLKCLLASMMMIFSVLLKQKLKGLELKKSLRATCQVGDFIAIILIMLQEGFGCNSKTI